MGSALHMTQLFFLRLPRPPTPTLFPYTTLFRSPSSSRTSWAASSSSSWKRRSSRPCSSSKRCCLCPSKDRKSTRLNSSHVRISYAVFCLKKKSDSHKKDEYKQSLKSPPSCFQHR